MKNIYVTPKGIASNVCLVPTDEVSVYTLDIKIPMDAEGVETLLLDLDNAFESALEDSNPLLQVLLKSKSVDHTDPLYEKEVGEDGSETGNVVLHLRQESEIKDGSIEVAIVDEKKNRINAKMVVCGATVRAGFVIIPEICDGKIRLALKLRAVQLIREDLG
jgi:hypothetical protein